MNDISRVASRHLRIAPLGHLGFGTAFPSWCREKVKNLALQESDLSPRELAVQFTDAEKYFVLEASVVPLPGSVLRSNVPREAF